MNRVNCNYEPESFTLFFFFYGYLFAYFTWHLCNFWKNKKKYTILKKKKFRKISQEFNFMVRLFQNISRGFNFADSQFQKISQELNLTGLGENHKICEIFLPRKFLPIRHDKFFIRHSASISNCLNLEMEPKYLTKSDIQLNPNIWRTKNNKRIL